MRHSNNLKSSSVQNFLVGIIAGAMLTFIIVSIIKYKRIYQEVGQGQPIPVESRNQNPSKDQSSPRKGEEVSGMRQDTQPATPSRFQHLDFLSELTRNPKLNIGVSIIGRNGKFGRSFKELFGLTDAEVKNVESRISTLREEFAAAALDKAEISEAPGLITIKIPPMENGPAFYDKFMDTMKSVLGPARFPGFVQLADKQVMRLFDGFGSEYRTIELNFSGKHLSDGEINVTEHTTSGGGYSSEWYSLKNIEEFKERFGGFEKIIIKH